MNCSSTGSKEWWLLTVVSGLSATLSYTLSVFASLPDPIRLLLAFAFGPFLMTAVLAFYHLICQWKDSQFLQVGSLFMFAAGTIVTLMFVVQQASFSIHNQLQGVTDASSIGQHELMFKEVNAVQLGIDITWDIFLSAGTFFIAMGIWQHPVFKRFIPILGLVSSVFLIAFNLYTFPVPPANAGLIDLGPVVATWWTLLTILIITRRRYFIELRPQIDQAEETVRV